MVQVIYKSTSFISFRFLQLAKDSLGLAAKDAVYIVWFLLHYGLLDPVYGIASSRLIFFGKLSVAQYAICIVSTRDFL